mgnify:CR=1 FL=1
MGSPESTISTQTEEHPETVAVNVSNVSKVFKDFWGRAKARAVQNLSFQVGSGQVFGLLGPNGSGKSTMVKMLLGLLYPTRGNVQILGVSPRSVRVKQRIGYLPEESYLYNYLSATETLDFFGALFKLSRSERRRRSEELLEMVGLSGAKDRAVGEFSKGMARRLGLAQALINDPDVIILDEPTSGLDPIGCREVKDIIRLLAKRGKTVFLSSHLLADVEDVCDEIIILYGGKIRAQGGLEDVLQVKDRTQITVPYLKPEALENVLNAVREQLAGQEEIEVKHPSMNLEEFFLDVVRKAKEKSVETAGVRAGGRIAEYLQGDISAEEGGRRDELLQALTGRGKEEASESADTELGAEEKEDEQRRNAAEASERISEMLEENEEREQEAGDEAADEASEQEGTEEQKEKKKRERNERLKGILGQEDGRQE